jgi:hypothetical protein
LNSIQRFLAPFLFLGVLLASASVCPAQVAVPVTQPETTNTDFSSSSLSNFGPTTPATTANQPAVPNDLLAVSPAADSTTPTSDWHLTVSPYLWFPAVHGGIGIDGRQTSFSVSAGDLLSHFRFGVMGVVEPRYKRIVMPLDIIWVRLGDDRALSNLATVANLKGTEFILTQKIGYRIIDTDRIKIDGLAGFRYWHYGSNVSFTTNTLNYSGSQNWVDPLVGGRITGILTPKIELTVAGDVGGWGAGSQLAYQAVGVIGYRIKPAIALQAGYRYLATNYKTSNGFVDIANTGVMFGVSISLK